jgi:hypothetical protein
VSAWICFSSSCALRSIYSLEPRSAFAHSRVSVASGVACERPVPKRIVERPGGVAKERLNAKRIVIVACSIVFERIGTACRIRAASCIELKRINAGGRVEATGRVEVERAGAVRCVEEAGGVKNQGVCAASQNGQCSRDLRDGRRRSNASRLGSIFFRREVELALDVGERASAEFGPTLIDVR